MELAFCSMLEELRIHMQRIAMRHIGLFQNFANALEGDCERFEVLGPANSSQRDQAPLRVHQIIGAGAKNGANLVVTETFSFTEDIFGTVENEVKDLRFLVRCDTTLGLVRQQRL